MSPVTLCVTQRWSAELQLLLFKTAKAVLLQEQSETHQTNVIDGFR
jgi:hypothetical protein